MLVLMVVIKIFPVDTSFAQVSIIKNPTAVGTSGTFYEENFNGLNSFKFSSVVGTPKVGEKIEQIVDSGNGRAFGYVASFDQETKVLKYFQDRSLVLESDNIEYSRLYWNLYKR